MSEWHIDFETYSTEDLKKRGAYKYASTRSTEIMMMGIAKGRERPAMWIHPDHEIPGFLETEPQARKWIAELDEDPEPIVWAHNAGFEMAVAKYRWKRDIGTRPPPVRAYRCTQVMARTAALPSSLDKIGQALNLNTLKDKEGTRLIQKFSIPNKILKKDKLVYGDQEKRRIMPKEDPADFKRMVEYCRQDVVVEQGVEAALYQFRLTGWMEQIFMCDSEINDRGIPINLRALLNARVIVREAEEKLAVRFRAITNLNHTQNEKYLAWLQEFGYPYDNLQANTVEQATEEFDEWFGLVTIPEDPPTDEEFLALHDMVKEALLLQQKLAFAAVKKIDAMIGCNCGDGYVRGTLFFYGAGTGRWSAKLIQPQNFKRPPEGFDTDGAYAMICAGCSMEDLELIYGDAIETVAYCIRHFIQRPHGDFLDADYSAIEARIVCWLAGQEDALFEYRKNLDRYVLMACDIYKKREKDVTKTERWVAKQAVLGCGFSMWVDAFQAQCKKYGVDVPYETCEKAVLAWRARNHKVVDLWDTFEEAARLAINNPGKWFPAGPLCKFGVTKSAGIVFLVLRLPSGRNIVYPKPAIEMVKREKKGGGTRWQSQITFWGAVKENFWGRCSTYGGKLVENATQGCAFDLMAHGTINATRKGYEVVTLVHDQALGNNDHPDGIEGFMEALTDLPEWAAGLPLAAEGGIAPYYTKG